MKDLEKVFNRLNKTSAFSLKIFSRYIFLLFSTLVFYIKSIFCCFTKLKKVIFVTYFTKKEKNPQMASLITLRISYPPHQVTAVLPI